MIRDPSGMEQIRFQERDPFEDFLDHPEHGGQRREASGAERASMDASLKKLARIFSNVPDGWQVDGALNISFIVGDYIGVHKDVDISIDPEKIEHIERELRNNGYGLFLSYPKDKKNFRGVKIMERVRHNSFTTEQAEHLMIAAIDQSGKILNQGDLNFIDVHLVRRNEQGAAVGFGGVPLPSVWQYPRHYSFHGTTIVGSHPARVAYYKLHDARAYDSHDLQLLAESGVLSVEDANDIERVCGSEILDREMMVREWIRGVLKNRKQGESVYELMITDPRVAVNLDRLEQPLRALAKDIASGEYDDMAIEDRALELAGIRRESADFMERVKRFVGYAQSAEMSKRVRNALR